LLQSTSVTVTIEQVDLLSVTGPLDGDGLGRLQSSVDELLAGGSRLLVADLSGVAGCDSRLFDLLSGPVTSSGAGTVGCGWSGWARRC